IEERGRLMADSSLFGFDSAFLQKLERLALLNRRPVPGSSAGSRRSPRHGSSVEFADFRDYAPGDDFRRIDWNAYARLERLFMRLYRAEENLSLSILVDASASMGWGKPTKMRLAARLAGALGFIALRSDDHVELATLRGGSIGDRAPTGGGQSAAWMLWRFLERVSGSGTTDLEASLTTYARQMR